MNAIRACAIWLLATCAPLPLCAEEHGRTRMVDSTTRATESVDAARRAASWNLTSEDWVRYEALMRGPRGNWTPNVDPLLALGAHARSEAERRRFAEAFVLAEHERVEGELAFERAVQAAWLRLFPGRLRFAALKPVDAAPAIERYAVVVERDCTDCARLLRPYITGTVPVDLYVRGAADDDDLRAWALAHGVQLKQVLGGLVTVNHGDVGVPEKAPAVLARRAGKWSTVE